MPDSSREDDSLMRSLKAGDEQALPQLIRRWERPLYSFAYRYVQADQIARDIVEETLVRLYTKRDQYNPRYSLSTWIFTIAANLCKNYARWRKRHPEDSLESQTTDNGDGLEWQDHIASDSLSPSEESDKNERFVQLREAIDELPHDLKATLLLHYYEGLSYQEISEVSNCSIRGVETRLYRARKRLKANWEAVVR